MSEGDAAQGETQNSTKKKKLPLKDKIMMGPLDKYQKYSKQYGVIFCADRFPWKFLVHILLVIATTTQVMMLNKSEGQLFRSHQIVFYTLFFDGGDPYLDINMARYRHIFQLYDDPEYKNIT